MSVIIPMDLHPSLHPGHIALLNFAKTISDDVTVRIMPNSFLWWYYLSGNLNFPTPLPSGFDIYSHIQSLPPFTEENCDFIKQIVSLGCKYYVSKDLYAPVDKDVLQKARDEAHEAVLSNYASFLEDQNLIWIAEACYIKRLLYPAEPYDVQVMGPELLNFVLVDMAKLLPTSSFPSTIIMPEMIKNPETGLRYGSSWNALTTVEYNDATVLKNIIDTNKISNDSSVIKAAINSSKTTETWTCRNIIIREGGLVPGKLETLFFDFPTTTISEVTFTPEK